MYALLFYVEDETVYVLQPFKEVSAGTVAVPVEDSKNEVSFIDEDDEIVTLHGETESEESRNMR